VITPLPVDDSSTFPVPPTRLVGRERECAAIGALLRSDDVRLVTLTGPGGVGKTHLSLTVAASIAPLFDDEPVFVPLAPIRDAHLVLPSITGALGIRPAPDQPLVDALAAALRGRRMLVLLDNFEQVMPAAPDIAALTGACPHLVLLITSRSPLRLRAEREFPVSPLALPEPNLAPSARAMGENAAVALFVERARAARPDFSLTGSNAPLIADICRQLDGLPLAIELAAAMTRVLSPQALLARTTNRLRLLTHGAPDLPDRHRTLRDTIRWSYDLLSPDEQTQFLRLSVFSGGCSLSAIEAVTGHDAPDRDTTLDLVTALVDKSLLVRVNDSLSADTGDDSEPRFRMLATINEFAAEQLNASDDADVARKRHLDWCLSLALRAEPELTGPAQASWLNRLDMERFNLRAALSRSAERWPVDGLRLASALWRYWSARGSLAEGHEWLTTLIGLGTDSAPENRAKAYHALGNLSLDMGDYGAAHEMYGRALELWERTASPRGIAYALNGQGLVDWYRGDHAAARRRHERSLALRRAIGDRHGEANSLTNLANAIKDDADGDQARARELHQQALAIRRELRDRGGVGYSALNIGDVARRAGHVAEAHSWFTQSLEAFREVGDALGVAYALQSLGLVTLAMGKDTDAGRQFAEAIAIRRKLGDRRGIIESIEGVAAVAASVGAASSAVTLFGAADALRTAIASPIPAPDRALYAPLITGLRRTLGTTAFDAAWGDGQAMPLQDAAEHAASLAADLAAHPDTPTIRLSEREIEVLRLVASGMTNAQAADRLFLSRRTVDAHMRRIYDKLDLTTRTDVVRFAVQHGLV
jgi:predicted ATPase/DNA-binding CsgD family transcriptional regulator